MVDRAGAPLGQIIAALEARYDPAWAEDWDAVGLVCGDPDAWVQRVMVAVDPVPAVVDEAVAWGADLLVTHHPLFLRPVTSVAASNWKGALVHRLISSGVALHCAHTNADVARPGVSDALADALGLVDLQPLVPRPPASLMKIVTFAPTAHVDTVIDAMAAAGAGVVGDYARVAWTSRGVGTFEPGPLARPAVGSPGQREHVDEQRIEMVLPPSAETQVVIALRAAHPYEEVAYDLYALASADSALGLGRVGRLPAPMSFEAFVAHVGGSLPLTAAGIRGAGDPGRLIERVAVCGGAGDSLLELVAGMTIDAYVTGDLRHHRAGEHVESLGGRAPALVDATHFATEWPWTVQAAELLRADLAVLGVTVETQVSTTVTDPWTLHVTVRPDAPGSTH